MFNMRSRTVSGTSGRTTVFRTRGRIVFSTNGKALFTTRVRALFRKFRRDLNPARVFVLVILSPMD